jgi:hypothetical protein
MRGMRSFLPFHATAARAVIVGVVLAATAGGCAFDRKWRALARADFYARRDMNNGRSLPDPLPDRRLVGRWDGKWVSEASGHTGRLRAIITPVDATTYHVDYDAMFLGVLRFGYGMNLAVTADPAGGPVAFEGQEDLGALAGGVYRYHGTADGQTFRSTYESGNDHGRFEMTRPRK